MPQRVIILAKRGLQHFLRFGGRPRREKFEYRSNIFKDGKWFEILRKIDPKRDISEYASTDPREAFAEAFSLYTSPLYGVKIKRMPKIVEEYLESLKQKE